MIVYQVWMGPPPMARVRECMEATFERVGGQYLLYADSIALGVTLPLSALVHEARQDRRMARLLDGWEDMPYCVVADFLRAWLLYQDPQGIWLDCDATLVADWTPPRPGTVYLGEGQDGGADNFVIFSGGNRRFFGDWLDQMAARLPILGPVGQLQRSFIEAYPHRVPARAVRHLAQWKEGERARRERPRNLRSVAQT